MRNTYLMSYFPLLAIILLSLSLAIRVEIILIEFLKDIGIYEGMLEFFSDSGVKLTLLFLLVVIFFMLFSALKIIADTVNGLALLFFSKDLEGENLRTVRSGSLIYFLGAVLSLLFFDSFLWIALVFLLSTVIYFTYFLIKISNSLTIPGIFGFVFFELLVWSTLILSVVYLALKLYNSLMASLPI